MTFVGAKKTSPGAVLFTVCLGQFLVPLMFTSVGVALPTIGRDLAAKAWQLGLVEQVYALALAMSMLTFGRLGDLIGRSKVLFAGLLVFTVMTATLGFARDIGWLIAQRLAQGFGAAMLLSGSMALVSTAYPLERRGWVIGVVSGFTYAGLTAGPLIGGFITETLGWRSVFWLAVPPGLAACVACLRALDDGPRAPGGETMDWPGAVLYAAGIALATFGASHAGNLRLGAFMLLAGAIVMALFCLMERRLASPLLDMRLIFENRVFSLGCLAAMGIYAATFGAIFFMSLYLQYAKGLSPRQAGFFLLLQPLLQTLLSPRAGRIADRSGPDAIANLGMAVCALGLIVCAVVVSFEAPVLLDAAPLILIGVGVGLFVAPNTTAIMNSAPPERYGVASGMIGAMRTLGLVVSMTVATMSLTFFMGAETAIAPETLPGFIQAMRASLIAYAVFSCLGLGATLLRSRSSRAQPNR